MFDLSGRTALITGSGQGIGLAIAEGLAKAGARIVLNGRRPEPLEAAAEILRATGAEVLTATFDVTDVKAVRQAVDRLEAAGVAVDILVNNAGIQKRKPLEDFEPED